MKVAFFPHKGAQRQREGKKWANGLKWGADFMVDKLSKYSENELEIFHQLNWNKIKTHDVIWFHNIATTAHNGRGPFKYSPIPKWSQEKNRPLLIGGVRGSVGFENGRKLLKYFDAIHVSNKQLLSKCKQYNDNVYLFYPGIDTENFKPYNLDKPVFTIGWAGDKSKAMKNFEVIKELGYPYNIATKENYIPHEKMPEFYNSLSAYTHFSEHEGSNRTIMEACSCGLPVIATDVGSSNIMLDPRWLVNYKPDKSYLVKEFKDRLSVLKNDGDLSKIVGKDNRKRVLIYDWRNVTVIWENIISEVYEANH